MKASVLSFRGLLPLMVVSSVVGVLDVFRSCLFLLFFWCHTLLYLRGLWDLTHSLYVWLWLLLSPSCLTSETLGCTATEGVESTIVSRPSFLGGRPPLSGLEESVLDAPAEICTPAVDRGPGTSGLDAGSSLPVLSGLALYDRARHWLTLREALPPLRTFRTGPSFPYLLVVGEAAMGSTVSFIELIRLIRRYPF